MKDICRNPEHSAASKRYYTWMVWNKVIGFWNHLTGSLFLPENKIDTGKTKPFLEFDFLVLIIIIPVKLLQNKERMQDEEGKLENQEE